MVRVRRLASLVLIAVLAACAHPKPPTAVAGVADTATRLEQSATALLKQAQQASTTVNPATGRTFISNDQLDTVALAVNKTGKLGLTLRSALDDYSALKAAGKDTAAQAAAVLRIVGDIEAGFQVVQRAIPNTVAANLTTTITQIFAIIGEIKTGVTLQ